MKKSLVLLAVVALVGSPLLAGPVQREQVSAKAKWVAHLDVQGLMAGHMGQFILDQIKAKGLEGKLNESIQKFGFDPARDLAGITLWGESYEPSAGVAIIHAKVDQDKLTKLLAANPNHRESKAGERSIHQWTQKPEGPKDDGTRFGTFYSDSITIIARTEEMVRKAIAVLDGTEPSLAKDDGSLLPATLPAGYLILAAKELMVKEPVPPQAAIFKKVAGGLVVVGEAGDSLTIKMTAVARNEKEATQFRQMLQGLVAFAQVANEQPADANKPAPDWLNLLQNVKVGGEGVALNVEATAPAKDVINMLVKAEAQKQAAAAKAAEAAPAAAK